MSYVVLLEDCVDFNFLRYTRITILNHADIFTNFHQFLPEPRGAGLHLAFQFSYVCSVARLVGRSLRSNLGPYTFIKVPLKRFYMHILLASP